MLRFPDRAASLQAVNNSLYAQINQIKNSLSGDALKSPAISRAIQNADVNAIGQQSSV